MNVQSSKLPQLMMVEHDVVYHIASGKAIGLRNFLAIVEMICFKVRGQYCRRQDGHVGSPCAYCGYAQKSGLH
jgi:hypothetical protein